MHFEVVGEIHSVEMIAAGRRIRIVDHLIREFGRGNWRKMKGVAIIRLENGKVRNAEIHWYEAHGVGRRKLKIKRYL